MRHAIVLVLIACASPAVFGQQQMAIEKEVNRLAIPQDLMPKGKQPLFLVRAEGVQIYQANEKLQWVFQSPQAKLLDYRTGAEVGSHSKEPKGPIWVDGKGSKLTGNKIRDKVAPNEEAIDWLLLEVNNENGGDYAKVTHIQRVDTWAGRMPTIKPTKVEETVRVPYQATYIFWGEGTAPKGGDANEADRLNRHAAEVIVKAGGIVSVSSEGGKKFTQIVKLNDMPKEPFRVGTVALYRMPKLADETLAALEGLAELQMVNFNYSRLSGGLRHLRQSPRLRVLYMQFATIDADGIKALAELSQLYEANLLGASVTDADLAPLGKHQGLGQLSLANTQVGDAGVAHLKGLTSLRILFLGDSKVTDKAANDLAQLKKLYWLDLAGTATGDDTLACLKDLPELSTFMCGKNVTDEGISGFLAARAKRIQSFSLSGCTKITDKGLEQLKEQPQLTFLLLQRTQVTDAGLKHLAKLKQLATIALDETNVTDDGLAHLAGLTNLTQVVLRQTAVTDAGMVHLTKLPRLSHVDLTGSKVTDAGAKRLKEALPKCNIVR
jgi:internalin A